MKNEKAKTKAMALAICGVLLVFSGVASASVILHEIPAPTASPTDLAWDGTYLWCGHWGNTIYKINPSDGSIIDSFSVSGPVGGLTWDGMYLWYSNRETDMIYKIDPSDGSIVESFSSPGSIPTGLSWDDESPGGPYLWHLNRESPAMVYKIDPSDGSIVDSFSAPATKVFGLAWDGTCLWIVSYASDMIYKVDSSDGSVVDSFSSPDSIPRGLTWDDAYLWNSDDNTDMIYQIDVPIPATVDINPDTLNLKSNGKWITAYIELPEGYDVADIDINTILLEDTISAEANPTEIGDYDDDGIADLMVKFDRSAQEILEVGDEVEITVTGELTDGSLFEGSDAIRVIKKGK